MSVAAPALPASVDAAAGPAARAPRARALPGAAVALVAGTVAAALALLAATADPRVALAPVAVVALAWAVLRLPVRVPLVAALALAMLADIAPGRADAAGAEWQPPTLVLQRLLTDNLNKLVPVEALRVSGLEVVLVGLIGLAALRALAGDRTDARGRGPMAAPMVAALLLTLATVVALEGWGLARGGDARQSLWQFRNVLWMPALALLAAAALRGVADARRLAVVVTVVSCVKVGIGAWYYLAVARPAGVAPAFVTSHADSVLFVVVLVGWLAAAWHRPTVGRVAAALGVGAWTMLGLVINNRRTAYVTLAATVALFYALLPPRTQRRLLRLALYALPVAALYLLAGRHRATGVFAPAAMVWSVTQQKDGSSITRDIENHNLLVTLRRSPVVGSGWGHEYVEQVKGDDISKFFPQYRYIAHNSVLWLWSIGGLVGFTLLWMPLVVGTFLAARSHHLARTPLERTAAYLALATFVAFVVQAWSDMGTQSWTTQGLLAVALATSAKLAHATGAWPAGTPLLGLARPAAGAGR